jgi:hypothetical protein
MLPLPLISKDVVMPSVQIRAAVMVVQVKARHVTANAPVIVKAVLGNVSVESTNRAAPSVIVIAAATVTLLRRALAPRLMVQLPFNVSVDEVLVRLPEE